MSKASKSYYARVLGTFWRHARTASLSLAACGAWVRCLSWCADQLSDGAIPASMLPMILGGRDGREEKRAIAELRDAGLLEARGTSHLLMRDWAQHNITFERHQELLDANRKRVAKSRGNAQQDASPAPPVTRYAERTEPPRAVLPSEQEQEQEHSRSSEREARAPEAPARTPLPESDPVASALRVGYQRRYQAQTGDAWLTSAGADGPIKRASAWCRAQPAPLEAVERFLDGAFAHGPWRAQRWPWRWLAEDPALTASRSSIAVGTMGEHPTLDDAMRARLASVPTYEPTGEEIPF